MLDTTHGYEAKLRAESVARRKRLNVGRVPAPIQENPAPSPNSDGLSLRLIAEPEGSGVPVIINDPITVHPAAKTDPSLPSRIMMSMVMRETCEHYGITVDGLLARNRTAPVVQRRFVAILLIRELTNASLPQIARRFGDMDHSSILNAGRRATFLVETDKEMAADVAAIRERVKEKAGEMPSLCPHCLRPFGA